MSCLDCASGREWDFLSNSKRTNSDLRNGNMGKTQKLRRLGASVLIGKH